MKVDKLFVTGPVGFSALESKVVISAHLEETSSGLKGRSKRAP
jgi:hypothetical protein